MRDQATSCYGMRIFQQEVARFNATTTMHIGMETQSKRLQMNEQQRTDSLKYCIQCDRDKSPCTPQP